MKNIFWTFLLIFTLFSCRQVDKPKKDSPTINADTIKQETVSPPKDTIVKVKPKPKPDPSKDETYWTNIEEVAPAIVLDMRYATSNNFVKIQLYDCGKCYLRPPVAKALLEVQKDLETQHLGLKMFDCFRPRPIQQKLWDKVPDPRYVTNPAKGSMHNRGAAVDLTIVDANGKELDMGTEFDYFGQKAYHTYTKHNDTINANRKILKETMEKHGFSSIRTEWWHYSYKKGSYKLSDYLWPCD